MEQPHPKIRLIDVPKILWKHRGKVILTFLTTFILIAIGTYTKLPMYKAESVLLIKYGRKYYFQSMGGFEKSAVPIRSDVVLNNEIRIMKSQDLIEKVVSSIGLENLSPELFTEEELASKSPQNTKRLYEKGKRPLKLLALQTDQSDEISLEETTLLNQSVSQFLDNLSVTGVSNSNILQISYKHPNPQLAAMAVELMVEFYKDIHLKIYNDLNIPFLEKQLEISFNDQEKAENYLQTFKEEYEIYSFDDQKRQLLQQYMTLDKSLTTSKMRIKELQKKLAYLKEQLKVIPKSLIHENVAVVNKSTENNLIQRAKEALLELELKESDLLRIYNEENQVIMNIRDKIKLVKNYLKKEQKKWAPEVATTDTEKQENPIYQKVEMDMIETETEIVLHEARLTNANVLEELKEKLKTLNSLEPTLEKLIREKEIMDKNYQGYYDNLQEALRSDAMDREKLVSISVIQHPRIPEEPISPRKRFNIILGAFLGVIAGISLAVVWEYFIVSSDK